MAEQQHAKIVEVLKDYLNESREAAREWQDKAGDTWDMIHGKIDWSHKAADQSRIHLNKVGLGLERIKSQFYQGLINFDEYFKIIPQEGLESDLMNAGDAQRFLMRLVGNMDLKTSIVETIGNGAVENVAVSKLQVVNEKIKGRNNMSIKVVPLTIRDYYFDPTMKGLYEFHESEIDKYELIKLSDEKPTNAKPYIKSVVEKLESSIRYEKAQEQDDKGNELHLRSSARRKSIVIHEFWGTILDDNGSIMEYEGPDGKFPLENVIITMANEEVLISEPKKNPRLNGLSPFVASRILRLRDNPYGRSLLGPGVDANRAEDELVSALVDGSLKATYNVAALKIHGLVDPKQATGGIRPGQTLYQNDSLAPNEKLFESQPTGAVPSDALSVLGIIQRSGAENMMSNEIALSGGLPSKQVRATELVQSQNAVGGLFEFFAALVEDTYLEKLIEQIFQEGLQHKNLLNDQDLMYIFNGDAEKAAAFKKATAKQVFDELSHSFRFRGKGVRGIAANQRQAQLLINMFNIIASNPVLQGMFERTGFNGMMMFVDVIKGFGFDGEKYLDPQIADYARLRDMIQTQTIAQEQVESQPNAGTGEQGAANPAQQAPDAGTEPGSGNGLQ